jgi:hypothetical protein
MRAYALLGLAAAVSVGLAAASADTSAATSVRACGSEWVALRPSIVDGKKLRAKAHVVKILAYGMSCRRARTIAAACARGSRSGMRYDTGIGRDDQNLDLQIQLDGRWPLGVRFYLLFGGGCQPPGYGE